MRANGSIIAVSGLSLLLILSSGCSEKKPPIVSQPRVQVVQVQRHDFAAPVTLTGDIQARVQTPLAFRVGGKIIQRLVEVGDHVTAKQVLAKLDPRDLQLNVNSALAAEAAEQARLKQNTTAFGRQQKLLPMGYTSRSEYDQALAALEGSKSAVAAAQAQLANAREQLRYTDLVADAPGTITARQAEVGQVVQASAAIFNVARDGERDAVFNVYEALLDQAVNGQPLNVTLLENPKIKAAGVVREVAPGVSASNGSVQVKVALSTVPPAMKLGSIVNATVVAAAAPSVELPWAALTKNVDTPAVWLVGDDHKVNLHNVTVSRYLTGKVIISAGLEGGEKVVVAGGQLLYPGMPVEIAAQTADPSVRHDSAGQQVRP